MKHAFLSSLAVVALLNTALGQWPPAPPGGGGGGARPAAPPSAMMQSVGQASGATGPDTGRVRTSSWNTKLIYAENCGSWLTVSYEECPVAFEDPRFNDHDMLCNNPMMSELYRQYYSDRVEGIWTWPEWGYCPSLPACLACPVLSNCGWSCSRSSCTGFTGWNPTIQQLQGECRTAVGGRFFCYVEENSPCSDTSPSNTFLGRFWSYDACD